MSNEITATELETRAVSEIEANNGNLDVGPSPSLDADLQSYYTTHSSGQAVTMARAIAEKLCDDGYHEAADAWNAFGDQMEVLAQFDGLLGKTPTA